MITINKCGPDLSWRLIHDGVKVVTLFHSKGITNTINTIFEAQTEIECLNEINRLDLEYTPVPEIVTAISPTDPLTIDMPPPIVVDTTSL